MFSPYFIGVILPKYVGQKGEFGKKIKGGDDHIERGLPTEGWGKGLKPFTHYTTIPISEGVISKFCIINKRFQVN